MAATVSLASGTQLGPYQIIAAIGEGGMGQVYSAHDTRLQRSVAIKILPSSVSTDPDRLRRFSQEARAASGLNHPNILVVHDIGEHNRSPYVVCELLEGATLRERLQGGPLPARKAVDYGIQIARGLAAAHERGIVHRDLKPENLFVTSDGHVKILDFGIAKLIEREEVEGSQTLTEQGATDPGLVLGTAGYMSPEQVRGQRVDHRSDIFSFGACSTRCFPDSERLRRVDHRDSECDPGERAARASGGWRRAGAAARLATLPRKESGAAVPVRARHRLRARRRHRFIRRDDGGYGSLQTKESRGIAWTTAGLFMLATTGLAYVALGASRQTCVQSASRSGRLMAAGSSRSLASLPPSRPMGARWR